jgi:hypothetical protein
MGLSGDSEWTSCKPRLARQIVDSDQLGARIQRPHKGIYVVVRIGVLPYRRTAASLRHRAATSDHSAFAANSRIVVAGGDHGGHNMVADAVLWALLAIAVVFFWWGCHNTRRIQAASAEPERSLSHAELDRAA